MKLKSKFLKIVVIVVILIMGGFIGLITSIYYYSHIDDAQDADAIVVLGASQWNGAPSPVFKARLDQAYLLYQEEYAPFIILTGGVGDGEEMSESQAGKDYLIQRGILEDKILLEEEGQTSWQSLNQVTQIIQSNKFNSIILVSDGFHMMRLKKMVKDLDIKALSSPALESPINKSKLNKFKHVVREGGVFILYLLFKV